MTMPAYSDDPLDNAHDPRVERAMKVTAQMSPEQRDAFFRALYRHIYAYHQSRNTDPLATFADSVIASVTLHSDPGYTHAVEAFQAAKDATLLLTPTGVPGTRPLDANDPRVQRAMKGIEQLTPAQRTEVIRFTYRYVYAYRQTRDPNLLIEFLNSVIGSVILRESPEYARAITEFDALKAATSHPATSRRARVPGRYPNATPSVNHQPSLEHLMTRHPSLRVAGPLSHEQRTTMTKTADTAAVPPPLPNAPYLIGSGPDGLRHAIAWTAANTTAQTEPNQRHRLVPTECDATATLITGWGAWTYDNPRLRRDTRCPTCGWAVALARDTTPAELTAIAPDPAELPALTRILDQPLLAVRLCQAILASGDYDRDHPHIRDLLGHATAHAPTLAVPEACAEDECDHQPADHPWDTWQCPYPDATAACPTCSVCVGGWAGEWEGQYAVECTVPAPCSVLTTLADHYGITTVARPAAASL